MWRTRGETITIRRRLSPGPQFTSKQQSSRPKPYKILEEDCGRLPRTRRPYYDGEKYDDDDYYDESAKEEQPQEPATAKDFKKDNPKMVTI